MGRPTADDLGLIDVVLRSVWTKGVWTTAVRPWRWVMSPRMRVRSLSRDFGPRAFPRELSVAVIVDDDSATSLGSRTLGYHRAAASHP